MRKIYKEEGIKIDHWKFGRTIRAVYMCDDGDPSVAVNESLPREPKLFSLVHELKHHYLDRSLIENGTIKCGDYNANELIEKTAEVFAAEFIYPEAEFLSLVDSLPDSGGQMYQRTGSRPQTCLLSVHQLSVPSEETYALGICASYGLRESPVYEA